MHSTVSITLVEFLVMMTAVAVLSNWTWQKDPTQLCGSMCPHTHTHTHTHTHLWSTSSANHLQYLRLWVFLEHSPHIVHRWLDNHQVGWEVYLEGRRKEVEPVQTHIFQERNNKHKLTPIARVLVETSGEQEHIIFTDTAKLKEWNCSCLTEHGKVSGSEHGLNSLSVWDIHPSMMETHSIH